jgi:hypothetical protein
MLEDCLVLNVPTRKDKLWNATRHPIIMAEALPVPKPDFTVGFRVKPTSRPSRYTTRITFESSHDPVPQITAVNSSHLEHEQR